LRGRHRRRRSIQNERQDQYHAQKQWSQRHAFTLPRAVGGRTRLLMNCPCEAPCRRILSLVLAGQLLHCIPQSLSG
jgi:hypothetical protein